MKTNPLKNKLALVVGFSVVVLFGIIAYAASTLVIAVGTIPHSELFDGPATVTVRQLLIAPGEVLAWHYHPGRAYNVIKRGTLTVEDGCGEVEVLTPGQAFEEVDGRVHRAKNLGTEELEIYNTFIVPQGNPTTVNIPNNERRCGPPRGVNECKNGWINFTHPRSFSNQSDCQQYVITEGVDTGTAGRSLVLYSLESAEFRTNLGINNLGTATANVTVKLVDKNGVQLGSLTTTVPAGGMTQINRVNVAFGVASPGVSLEGTLRLEADQNIVAWTSQIDNLTQDSSLVVGKSLHPAKLLIPSVTRVGSFRSNLVVANLDASPATVELKFRDVDGNLKASSVEVIPGNGLLSSADILGKLGMAESYGPLEILSVSGKPILALSRVYSLQRTAGAFEGVP